MSSMPILLFSGWAMPGALLKEFAEALDHPVTIFDLCNPRIIDTQQTILEAAQEIVAAQPAPPLLVGWSTGALLALEAATRPNTLLSGIIALSATACFCTRTEYAFGQPPEVVRALREGVLCEETKVRTLKRFYRESAHPDRLSRSLRDQLAQTASALDGEILAAGLDYLMDTDIRNQLHNITAPALFIHGQDDAIIPAEAAQWAVDHMSTATLHTLAGAGHLLPLLRSTQIVHHIQTYIEEVLP